VIRGRSCIVDGRWRTISADQVELGERVTTWHTLAEHSPALQAAFAGRIAAGWRPKGTPILWQHDGRPAIKFVTSRGKATPMMTEDDRD